MKWTEIVTAIVALYGAVLATITYVNQWRNARPRLKISIQLSRILMPSGKHTDTVITITPQNYGQKKVVLETMGFLFPKEKKAFQVPRPFGAVQLPHELEPEASCTMWVEARGIAKSLREEGVAGQVKAIAYVLDTVGRQYRSNALAFDVNRWDSDTKT